MPAIRFPLGSVLTIDTKGSLFFWGLDSLVFPFDKMELGFHCALHAFYEDGRPKIVNERTNNLPYANRGAGS
jgi:hypothetical protein